MRNNKNGNMSIKKWVALIHNGEINSWMSHHKVSEDVCPPKSLISTDVFCYYCVSCQKHCISQVKEFKNHYQVGKVKFMKEDLDKLKGE